MSVAAARGRRRRSAMPSGGARIGSLSEGGADLRSGAANMRGRRSGPLHRGARIPAEGRRPERQCRQLGLVPTGEYFPRTASMPRWLQRPGRQSREARARCWARLRRSAVPANLFYYSMDVCSQLRTRGAGLDSQLRIGKRRCMLNQPPEICADSTFAGLRSISVTARMPTPKTRTNSRWPSMGTNPGCEQAWISTAPGGWGAERNPEPERDPG